MDSKIYIAEGVVNTERIFGSTVEYYPATIVFKDGSEKKAMFKISQINNAVYTAERNPEDWPEDISFWEKLFLG